MTENHRTVRPPPVKDSPAGQRIRLVLGFSPGSASDQIARTIAPAFAEHLGESVDVLLFPGRNGADAAEKVAASAPDGRTLFMATLGTHALAPHLGRKLGYDPVRDFAPVLLLTRSPLLLACHPLIPSASSRELIQLAKTNPGQLTYGSSAVGGAPHLAAELFQEMAGIKLRHVQYAETERLYRDLENGHLSLSFNNMMSMLPRCGRRALRALAVTSATRNTIAPGIPTVAESGLAGYEVVNWLGIVAPKATPEEVIARLSAAARASLRSGVVQNALLSSGIVPCGGTSGEFGQFIAAEIERWGPVVKRFRETA